MIHGSSRRTPAALAIGLALLAAGPARAQRAGAPAGVPTHLGGGVPHGLGGGVPNGLGGGVPGNAFGGVPAAGQIGIYSPFYGNYFNPYGSIGYGGFGYGGLGYGYGYGGYGGFATGFPGYGYGGYGGFGTGGIGVTIGMSPFDQEALKDDQYALNAAQYNLQNARAAAAYQEANLLQQQAIAQAQANYGPAQGAAPASAGYAPRYSVANATTRPYPPRLAMRNRGRSSPSLLPREKVLGPDGRILWPESLPRDPELGSIRQGVDTAFRDVVDDYNKNHRAAIRDAVNARDKLYAFGNLAQQKYADEKNEAAIPEFQVFLASLDRALVAMTNTNPRAMPQRTRPDNQPRSAGDVLKDDVARDRHAAPDAAPRAGDQAPPPPTPASPDPKAPGDARPPAAGDVRPGTQPKSAGDVLRDSIRTDGDRKP